MSAGPSVGLGLTPAPTYRPTPEQFRDPLSFIASIRAEAERFGICKIVPPEGWKPPFQLDKDKFSFKTRIQSVSELQQKVSSSSDFKQWNAQYLKWLKLAGKERKRNPIFGGKDINLFKFHRLVKLRGGYQTVCEAKGWREVARLLGVTGGSNLSYGIRTLYAKTFQDFDLWVAGGSKDVLATENINKQEPAPKKALSGPEAELNEAEAALILESLMNPGDAADEKEASTGKRKATANGSSPRKKKKKDKEKAVPVLEHDPHRVPANINVLVCEVCTAGHHEDKIILCDRCDRGFHLFCLSPPLDEVPDGEWICPLCVERDNDASFFRDGPQMTIAEMQSRSSSFARKYWGDTRARKGDFTAAQLEHEFWRIVEGGEEPVEVFYGADLDTGKVGSGFPRRGESDDPYATHPWNVNNFPKLDGVHSSLLKHVTESIQGVIVPWLYIGMMFSSFCWHVEDHMFYSINYNHWGAPKQWYGVPSDKASDFEDAFKKSKPDLFEHQADLLFHLVTMLSPRALLAHDVPVYSCLQSAGEFVITFPNAYHGGFNHGVNAAEAVNFVPADWLRFGAASMLRYRAFRKPSVLSHEELLMHVVRDESPLTGFWVAKELARVVREEAQLRSNLWAQGVRKCKTAALPVGFKEKPVKDHPECAVCKTYLYFSAVECERHPGRYCCPHHAHALCDCGPPSWIMHFRHSLRHLLSLVQGAYDRPAPAPLPAGSCSLAVWRPPLTLCTKDDTHHLPVPEHLRLAAPPQGSGHAAHRHSLGVPPQMESPAADRIAGEAAGARPSCAGSVDDGAAAFEFSGDAVMAEPQVDGGSVAMDVTDGRASDACALVDTYPAGVPRLDVAFPNGLPDVKNAPHDDVKLDGEAAPGADAPPTIAAADPLVVTPAADGACEQPGITLMECDERAKPFELVTAAGVPVAVTEPVVVACAMQEGDAPPPHDADKPAADADAPSPGGDQVLKNEGDQVKAEPVDYEADAAQHMSAFETMQHADPALVSAAVAAEVDEWKARAAAVLREGNARPLDVETLLAQSHMFLWGDLKADDVQELAAQLSSAKDWFVTVQTCVKGKASFALVDELLDRPLLPVAAPAVAKLKEAHRKVAEWNAKLDALRSAMTVIPLGELEALAAQGARLPLDAPKMHELTAEIGMAKTTMDRVRSATRERLVNHGDGTGWQLKIGSADDLLPAPELKALLQQAQRLGVAFAELGAIAKAVEVTEAWLGLAQAARDSRCSLSRVQELVVSGDALPAICPEVDVFKQQVASARQWTRQAAAAMSAGRPLPELRELLQAGEQLPVETPEAAALQKHIRQREWEKAAAKALAGDVSISDAAQLLAEAAAIGAAESLRAQDLQKAVAATQAWDARAAELSARCEGEPPGAPSLEELTDALAAGSALQVRSERFQQLAELQARADAWTRRADGLLSSASPLPALAALEDAAESGAALRLHLPQLAALRERIERVGTWNRSTAALLASPAEPSQVSALQAAVDAAAPLGVRLDDLAALKNRLAALKWGETFKAKFAAALRARAQPLDGAAAQTDAVLPLADGVSADANPHAATAPGGAPSADAMDVDAANAISAAPMEGVANVPPANDSSAAQPAAGDVDMADAHAPVAASIAPGSAASATAPVLPQGALAAAAEPQAGSAGVTTAAAELPSFDDARALLALAAALPVQADLMAVLQDVTLQALAWETVAAPLLRKPRPEPLPGLKAQAAEHPAVTKLEAGDAGAKADDVRRLLSEAGSIAMRLPSRRALEETLAVHEAWNKEVADILGVAKQPRTTEPTPATSDAAAPPAAPSGVTADPSVAPAPPTAAPASTDAAAPAPAPAVGAVAPSDSGPVASSQSPSAAASLPTPQPRLALDRIAKLCAAGERSALECPLLPRLKALSEQCRGALEKARAALVKRGGAIGRVDRAAEAVRASLRKALASLAALGAPKSEDEAGGSALLCLCQQEYVDGAPMVACDACGDWYHMKCCNVTTAQVKNAKRWDCPVCLSVKSRSDEVAPCRPRVHVTAEPTLAALNDALAALRASPAALAEEAALQEVVALAKEWQRSLAGVLEKDKAAPTAAQRLTPPQLQELVRIVISVELDTGAVCADLLARLRLVQWLVKLEAATGGTSRPTLEALAKVVKEGEGLDGADAVPGVVAARAAVDSGRELCKAAADMMASAAEPTLSPTRVRELLVELRAVRTKIVALPIKADRVLKEIDNACQTYCLCEMPYRENAAMIECEQCSDWYHFDCMGIGRERVPTHFTCVVCCAKGGKPFKYAADIPACSVHAMYKLNPAGAPAALPGRANPFAPQPLAAMIMSPPAAHARAPLPPLSSAAAAHTLQQSSQSVAPHQPPPGTAAPLSAPPTALQAQPLGGPVDPAVAAAFPPAVIGTPPLAASEPYPPQFNGVAAAPGYAPVIDLNYVAYLESLVMSHGLLGTAPLQPPPFDASALCALPPLGPVAAPADPAPAAVAPSSSAVTAGAAVEHSFPPAPGLAPLALAAAPLAPPPVNQPAGGSAASVALGPPPSAAPAAAASAVGRLHADAPPAATPQSFTLSAAADAAAACGSAAHAPAGGPHACAQPSGAAEAHSVPPLTAAPPGGCTQPTALDRPGPAAAPALAAASDQQQPFWRPEATPAAPHMHVAAAPAVATKAEVVTPEVEAAAAALSDPLIFQQIIGANPQLLEMFTQSQKHTNQV